MYICPIPILLATKHAYRMKHEIHIQTNRQTDRHTAIFTLTLSWCWCCHLIILTLFHFSFFYTTITSSFHHSLPAYLRGWAVIRCLLHIVLYHCSTHVFVKFEIFKSFVCEIRCHFVFIKMKLNQLWRRHINAIILIINTIWMCM